AIRNYANFWGDSSYSMQFDSILFKNDRIFLSNFNFRQLDGHKPSNSFTVPEFELQGLSWDELVFNHRLKATEATLYHPLINYAAREFRHNRGRKQNIFDALAAIDQQVQLGQLNIEKGQLNIALKENIKLQLEDATFSVQSRSLLHARKIIDLEH